jgi:hypothetical protein
MWSRFWDTVAAFPAAPAPRGAKPTKLTKVAPGLDGQSYGG